MLHVLAFGESVDRVDTEGDRFGIGAAELRDLVGRCWEVDDVRPVSIHANLPPDAPLPRDARGRGILPANLLCAHLPA